MNTDSSAQDTGRNDSVLNLHHEEADRGREHKDVVPESVTEIAGEVVNSDDDASVLQGCNESNDNAKGPASLTKASPPRKKRARPMTAAEQAATIAALQEKLMEFPPTPPKRSSSASPKKNLARQRSSTLPNTTSLGSADITQSPSKKRKSISKANSESPPKQPRPQKRTKKETIAALKQPTISPNAKSLIDMMVKLNVTSTAKDVDGIVVAALNVLRDPANTVKHDQEITALVAQEDGWKIMAEESNADLKENIKKFMERYGIIPMGALEAAECT